MTKLTGLDYSSGRGTPPVIFARWVSPPLPLSFLTTPMLSPYHAFVMHVLLFISPHAAQKHPFVFPSFCLLLWKRQSGAVHLSWQCGWHIWELKPKHSKEVTPGRCSLTWKCCCSHCRRELCSYVYPEMRDSPGIQGRNQQQKKMTPQGNRALSVPLLTQKAGWSVILRHLIKGINSLVTPS